MGYLLPAGVEAKRQTNLGRLRGTRMMRLRGLGQDDGAYVYTPQGPELPTADQPSTIILPTDIPIDTTESPISSTLIPPVAAAPQQPGVSPSGGILFSEAQIQAVSKDPLAYSSPQAAIAAGIPSQTAMNAWSKYLAKFPTQNAALAAGVPAGVVTAMWAQSRSAAPVTSSLFGGISKNTLLLVGGGIVLLAALGGRKRR